MKLLTACFIVTLFGALAGVHGLQCFTCSSETSMDDCSSKQIKKTCPADESGLYCGNLTLTDENGILSYNKGCFSEDVCLGDFYPCNQPEAQCNGQCCFYDLCNGAGGEVEQISCYHCTSDTSLEDCTKEQTIQKCEIGWSQCGMLEIPSQSKKSYAKGCITPALCQKFCAGGHNDVVGIDCKLSCCGQSLCN